MELLVAKAIVALGMLSVTIILWYVLKNWELDHRDDNRCVSCGHPSRDDFCDFCLHEE